MLDIIPKFLDHLAQLQENKAEVPHVKNVRVFFHFPRMCCKHEIHEGGKINSTVQCVKVGEFTQWKLEVSNFREVFHVEQIKAQLSFHLSKIQSHRKGCINVVCT